MIMTALRKTGILELYKQKWPAGQRLKLKRGTWKFLKLKEAHLLHMGLEWLRDIHRIHYTPYPQVYIFYMVRNTFASLGKR